MISSWASADLVAYRHDVNWIDCSYIRIVAIHSPLMTWTSPSSSNISLTSKSKRREQASDNAFVVALFLTFKAGGDKAELREEQGHDEGFGYGCGVSGEWLNRTQSAVYLPALGVYVLALQKVSFCDGGGNDQDDSRRFRTDIGRLTEKCWLGW